MPLTAYNVDEQQLIKCYKTKIIKWANCAWEECIYLQIHQKTEQGHNLCQLTRQSFFSRIISRIIVVPSASTSYPSRPNSSASAGLLRVQMGNQWLGGGRNLHREAMKKRPHTAQTPGWRQGLNSRPTTANSQFPRYVMYMYVSLMVPIS